MSGWSKKSGSRPDPANRANDHGAAQESAAAFREGLAAHLKARAELLGLETREAGQVVARKGALGVVVALLLFFAYALLLTSGVSLLAGWLATSWEFIALGAAVLHILLALILFSKLRRKPEYELFEFTRAEFQKDREWLHQNHNPSGSKSDSSP